MTRWLSDTESAAWRGYNEMAVRLEARLARDIAPFGLSMPDYAVLVNLSEATDHRLRMHELAARMQWSRSRLSHHVARMEARRLLSREECPSDARGSHVRLTEGGLLAIEEAAPAHLDSVRAAFVDVLTPDEVAMLAVLTQRVVAALGREGSCPASPPSAAPQHGCC